MLKMPDEPDELLKTKGKFEHQNIYADGCLKIKELLQNSIHADMLLKGSIVIERCPVSRLQSCRIPAENGRRLAILGRRSACGGSESLGTDKAGGSSAFQTEVAWPSWP